MEDGWDFCIPLQKEDLQKKHAGQYYVAEVLDLKEALSLLKGFKAELNRKGCECILRNFDVLYSILCDKDITFLQLQDIYDTLINKLINSLKEYVEKALRFEDPESKREAVNVIKMVFYIFSLFIRAYEDKLAYNADNFISDPKRGKNSKVKTTRKAEDCWDWAANKKAAFVMFYPILQANIGFLWPTAVADEPFINMVANCCYKAFENPEIVQAKLKPLRDSIGHVLSTLVMNYNHGLTFVPKVVQLMKTHEHAVSAISSSIFIMVTEYKANTILPKLLRELTDTIRDEDVPGLAKSTATFITDLAEANPSILLPSVKILVRNLIVEPYAVRNATLIAFSEIILKCLKSPNASEDEKALRDKLFRHLHNHIRDQNSYVRSKVLQLWIKLAFEHAIPKDILLPALQTAKNRISDKSCHTVKNSIQLFTTVLKDNPWTGKLSLTEMQNQLTQAKAKLKSLENKKTFSREEAWKQVEGDLILQLSNKITESEEDDAIQYPDTQSVNVEDVMIIITKLIQEKHFVEAYNLLKQSEMQFPNANEIRINMSSKDKVEYYLAALKKIFFTSDDTNEKSPWEFDIYAEDYEKQRVVVKYLEDSIAFAQLMNEVGQEINQVLKGKSSIEVLEAIEFFTAAFQFGVADARKVIRSTLLLVNCKQPGVKEAVAAAYKTLYLVSSQPTPRAQAIHIVHRLTKLLKELDRSQTSAFEVLIEQWMNNNELSKEFFQILWERFTKKSPQTTEDDSMAALILLDMISCTNKPMISSNISLLLEHGLSNPSSLSMVEHTCNMIRKYALTKVDGKYVRMYSDNEIFKMAIKSLVDNFDVVPSKGFIPMALSVINMIFKLCCYPEKVMDPILKVLYEKSICETNSPCADNMADDSNTGPRFKETLLKRLFHIYGEILFRKLQYFEKDVVNSLKKEVKTEKDEPDADEDEDDLCQRHDREEAAAEAIVASSRELCENLVMENDTINGHIRELIIKTCKGLNEPISVGLQCAAATALAKLMMVSQTFCENYVQVYVTLMAKSKEEMVRQNLVLGFGDLTWRYPNVIEPWTHHLYERLKDLSTTVRKNTVVVLFHLITREMIKVRGQMAEICLCLEDPEPSIAEQVQSLIIDLSQKGNTLYNVIPDIISRLSNPDRPDPVPSDVFKKIMKFTLGLIGKERQNELLVEKLCARIKEADNERQWQDLSFCLSQLNYNEKSLRRLLDSIPMLHERLFCPQVYDAIAGIASAANKTVNKPSMKELAGDIHQKLEDMLSCKSSEQNNDDDDDVFAKSKCSVPSTPRKNIVPSTPRTVKGSRLRSTRKAKK